MDTRSGKSKPTSIRVTKYLSNTFPTNKFPSPGAIIFKLSQNLRNK